MSTVLVAAIDTTQADRYLAPFTEIEPLHPSRESVKNRGRYVLAGAAVLDHRSCRSSVAWRVRSTVRV